MAPSRGEEEEMAAAGTGEASPSSGSTRGEGRWNRKQEILLVTKLWWAGFKDACCLNRAYLFCRRSHRVWKKTRECFLLNGCAFLGSIVVLQHAVIPALQWLLNTSGFYSRLLQKLIIGGCYLCWLYPLYIISFVLNCLWYNEIAVHAFGTLDQQGTGSDAQPRTPGIGKSPGATRSKSTTAIESVMLGIGEQIYSIIMLSIFFAEVSAVSFIPYVGPLLKFVLMSWLYAYYCFDYKWGLRRWSLERRLLFFETNWAFFAGFGSPCVLATFFLSPLVGGGVMAVVFPLFVLVATASDPEQAVSACLGGDRDSGLPRLHVFYFANKLTVPFVHLFQPRSSISNGRKKMQ